MQLCGKQCGVSSKKLKLELSYDPAFTFLGIYPKEMKTLTQKDIGTPVFVAALFTIAKVWKQTESPLIEEWMKKMWCIYV